MVDLKDPDLEGGEENAAKNLSQPDVDQVFNEMANSTLSDLNWNPNGGGRTPLRDRAKTAVAWARNNKKKLTIFSVGGAAALTTLFITAFMPALQLIHIKEVMATNLGGIQSHVFQTRSGKLYSRGFFFDDDGNFSGYKARGSVFSVFENRSTNRLVADLESKNMRVAYDQQTGRIRTITLPGGEVINNSEGFISMWRQRGAVREGLDELYPDRGRVWRSVQARKLFRRMGISWTLTNWIDNTRLVRKVNELEDAFRARVGRSFTPAERFRLKLRHALFGDILDNEGIGRISLAGDAPDDADEGDANNLNDAKGVTDDIAEEAAEQAEEALSDPSFRPDDLASEVLHGAVSSVDDAIRARYVSLATRAAGFGFIADVADKVCRIKYLLDAVEIGSRTVRATQLSAYSASILSLGDLNKTGALPADDLNGLMTQVNTPDEEGRTFFGTGGWRWAEGDTDARVSPSNVDRYSPSGGSVETLAAVNGIISSAPGDVSCSVATNPIFQIAVSVVEVVVTYAPCLTVIGCTFTASTIGARIAGGVGIEMAYSIGLAVLQPLLVRMVAGMVVDGGEFGPEMSDALVSGSSAMFGRRSMFAGFRPLSRIQLAQLDKEVIEGQRAEIAKQGVVERYLDPTNHRSLTAGLIPSVPTTMAAAQAQLRDFGLSSLNPVNFLGRLGGAINTQQVGALGDGGQCTDLFITQEKIATDPFCNPLYGEDEELIDGVDPMDNLAYLIDNGYIMGDLTSEGEFEPAYRIDEDGNRVITNKGEYFREYVEQCFESINPLYQEDGDTTDKCIENGNNTPLQSHDQQGIEVGINDRIRMARIDQTVADSIFESINREFASGEVTVQQEQTTPSVGGLQSPPNLGPANSEGYYTMPDPAEGTYQFNAGTPPRSRCGAKPLIDMIYTVSKRWYERYPGSKLVVGDLNEEQGHASHNYGVDVDITTADRSAANANGNASKSLELAKMFADTRIVEVIGFQDNRVIGPFNSYAQSQGLPARMEDWSGHRDHFHVRILSQYRGVYSGQCAA